MSIEHDLEASTEQNRIGQLPPQSPATMAGVSDKARFYLERAAPELREFEEKEIFSKVRSPRWPSLSPKPL
jgi:hypothetical protein